MKRILSSLLLVLVLFCGLADRAEGAAYPRQNIASKSSDGTPDTYAYEFDALALGAPWENTTWLYDPVTGVRYYVNQNPWSAYDPYGLYTLGDLKEDVKGVVALSTALVTTKVKGDLNTFSRIQDGYNNQDGGFIIGYETEPGSPERLGQTIRDVSAVTTRGSGGRMPSVNGPRPAVVTPNGAPVPAGTTTAPVSVPVPAPVVPNELNNQSEENSDPSNGAQTQKRDNVPKVNRTIPKEKLKYKPKKRGNAPIGEDGKPVELHHNDQSAGNSSTRSEMTRTEHRGPGNFKKNHPNTGQKPSKVERNESRTQHRNHWKKEYDSGRFDDLPPQPGS